MKKSDVSTVDIKRHVKIDLDFMEEQTIIDALEFYVAHGELGITQAKRAVAVFDRVNETYKIANNEYYEDHPDEQ